MSVVSSSDATEVFDYASGLDAKYISYVPESIQKDLNDIWYPSYGAYIFQAPGDPMACGKNATHTFSCYDVVDAINRTTERVRGSCEFNAAVIDGVDMYVLGALMERVSGPVTTLTLASLFKYYFTVLKIRQDAFTEEVARAETEGHESKVNQDWLIEGDARADLFQENIPKRDLLAIAYVGSEMHLPLLRADREKVRAKEGTALRVRTLFESPRFRAYKTFVYDKSTKNCWNAVTWLKSRCKKLVHSLSIEHKDVLLDAIETYADSMRTSTTGSVISSAATVFAPKSVEGDRLITNLFKYHLPQVLDGELTDELKLCADRLESFLAEDGQRNRARNSKN